MENSVKITLIITGAVVLLALIGFSMFSDILPTNTINANGLATMKVAPDLVTLNFNVETKADTAKQAKDENAEIVDDLIVALIKQGFERKDIVTENFNIYPEYNWNSGDRELTGYKASHGIKLELSTDDSEDIGDAIDAGVDAGAEISYINFELSQELQNQYKAEALKQATQDAQIKAQSIADGLGKKLGKVVSISSSNFNYSPWALYDARGTAAMGGEIAEEAKQAATNIQPGEQEVYASVQVVYKIR